MTFEGLNKVEIAGGPISYNLEGTSTNLYIEKVFGNGMNSISIVNDHATDPIQVSYDGATLAGTIKANEEITLNVRGKSSVYIKSTGGTANYRLFAW